MILRKQEWENLWAQEAPSELMDDARSPAPVSSKSLENSQEKFLEYIEAHLLLEEPFAIEESLEGR